MWMTGADLTFNGPLCSRRKEWVFVFDYCRNLSCRRKDDDPQGQGIRTHCCSQLGAVLDSVMMRPAAMPAALSFEPFLLLI